MPIQHPTYALPLQSANTIATKQSHDAELNRVVTILVENDRDLNATFERAIVTGPIVGEWDAGTGAFPTLRPNGDQIRVGDTWRVTGNGTVDGQAFYSGDYLQAITAGGGVTFNGNWARAALGQIEADRIAAETAAASAQAYAEMAEFTRITVIASGDGTATPITLPISVDSALRVQVFVNMTRWVPGDDYTVSGYDLAPVSPLVWPEGDRNLLIMIDRPFDSEAPTSDDVTHDGQPISQILDRIDADNTFYLQDYLHPDDLAGIAAGDTALQTGSRVTAAINLCLEEALAAAFAVNGASVVVDIEPGIYRINNRLMTDAFNTALWNAPAMSRSRLWFRTDGSVTFRVQNWAPGRAAVRADGIYAGSTHIAPIAVFEWFQPTGRQNFGGMDGQWIIEGADNPAGDPIGWYFYRLNATRISGNIECRNLRNRNFVFDSIFNSKVDYARSAVGGLMLTECGGTGLLPNDTVAGTVRTGLRYTVSGTTLTINTMVYDSAGPSYAYTPYSVFTADHVGKWIALDRQGVDNLLGDDSDDGNEGGSTRRSARWFQIASVTDGSTVELTEAPPYQTSTGQWVPQNRTVSFEVLKVSVTASSTAATLSMPVSQSLVGLEVVIPGAGYSGGPTTLPDLVAMVTAHSGASITLSHAARISKSGVPFVTAPQAALSSLSHTALAETSRKCDDLHFGRLWCESGTAPGLPLHIQNTSNVTLGDESKLHGSPLNTPNFGANFACVLGGEIGARLAGRFTHSRHSPRFGMFYITGDRSEIKLDGELSSWTPDNGSAIWYLDPANVATTRIWDIYYNASDYATGFPNIGGGQVFERGGANWTPGRIKAGASQRSPRGERPSWPQAAMPAVRSPALGGARADAVSAVARGWVPDDGVVYTIGGLQYLGQTGATAIADLPGLTWAGERDVRHFGAESGAADVLAAFVAARDSVPAGQAGKVIVPPGVWNISAPMSANNGNFVEWVIQDGAQVLPSVAERISGATRRIVRPRTGAPRWTVVQGVPQGDSGGAILSYDVVRNTGLLDAMGYGRRYDYSSSAYGFDRFDIADGIVAGFTRDPGNGGGQMLTQWLVALSPTTGDGTWENSHGTFVAEWNIVNRGADTGFAPKRGDLKNFTGGLQMVIEDDGFIGATDTKNVTFGIMFGGQTPTGNAVDKRRFYAGLLGEPDAIAGETGRAIFWTGDTTGQANRIPLSFVEAVGRWGYGLKLNDGTFDTAAIAVPNGSKISWQSTSEVEAGALAISQFGTVTLGRSAPEPGTVVNRIVEGAGSTNVQRIRATLWRTATDPSSMALTTNGNAGTVNNSLSIPDNSAAVFSGDAIALDASGNVARWTFSGIVQRGVGAATTVVKDVTATKTYFDAAASTWVVTVTANTVTGGLWLTMGGTGTYTTSANVTLNMIT